MIDRRIKTRIALVGGAALAAIAVISDIGGTFTAVGPLVRSVYQTRVSLLWLIALVAIVGSAIYFVMRRQVRPSPDITSIENNGQFYEKIQEQLCTAKREIIVVGLEKDWVFPLVVSVAIARSKGRDISVGFFHEDHERYRLLELLGCRVTRIAAEKERNRFVGVLSDPNDILNCRATVRTARQSETIYGRHYFSALDYWAIAASNAHLAQILRENAREPTAPASTLHVPQFVEVAEEEVLVRLKRVRFYERARLSFQEVSIAETRPVSKIVSRFKLNQVKDICRLYDEKGWQLFRPSGITLANGQISMLVPPVLEEHNGRLYVAEGHTRLFFLREKGIKTIRCLVVREIDAILPMMPTTWRRVDVVDDKREKGDPRLARYIETTAHQGVWGMPGESSIPPQYR